MKYGLHISTAAERDIEEAADYIENVLKNPQAADALLDAIDEVLPSLQENPQRVPVVSEPVLRTWEIRSIKIKNYLVLFRVDDENASVVIVRFLYAKRNWWTILKDNCYN